MTIGPALPPHLAHLAGRSTSPSVAPDASESESDDNYGPALPPHLAAARKRKATDDPAAGPSTSRSPESTPPPVDDDSDDDVIGPVPGAATSEKTAVEEFLEREERRAKERENALKPKKLAREEWMLVPPTSGVLSSVDPLRKRPTTFSKSSAPIETDNAMWTETPQQKAQRIADEVAGIKRKRPPRSGEVDEGPMKRARDMEIREGIEKHNKEQRGKSLLEQHSAKPKKSEEPAFWDHDRDMGITGRLLNDQERQAKIREARGLNDRFGHSKRGAYDM